MLLLLSVLHKILLSTTNSWFNVRTFFRATLTVALDLSQGAREGLWNMLSTAVFESYCTRTAHRNHKVNGFLIPSASQSVTDPLMGTTSIYFVQMIHVRHSQAWFPMEQGF
jgi:hypothetical protein